MRVDIASLNSTRFWLVELEAGAGGCRPVPQSTFASFDEAVAARHLVDRAPPISRHPLGICECGERVLVAGVGLGKVVWIHANGDVRVDLDDWPGRAEYFDAALIRRPGVKRKPQVGVRWLDVDVFGAVARELAARPSDADRAGEGIEFAFALVTGQPGAASVTVAATRPTDGEFDDGLTLELHHSRLGHAKPTEINRLLHAAARAASKLGYRRLMVQHEEGLACALAGAGWARVAAAGGKPRPWLQVLRAGQAY